MKLKSHRSGFFQCIQYSLCLFVQFEELCRAFSENVPLGRHVRYFRMYTDCFVASEAVTWFHRQLRNTTVQFFVTIPSRYSDEILLLLYVLIANCV